MEGVETDGWVTEMVRYVICPDEDIWYIWSDNARQRMTLILNVLSSLEICFYLLCICLYFNFNIIRYNTCL